MPVEWLSSATSQIQVTSAFWTEGHFMKPRIGKGQTSTAFCDALCIIHQKAREKGATAHYLEAF